MTIEPASCPITWSTKFSGIGTSSVVSKFTELIQSLTLSANTSSLPVGSGAHMVTSSSAASGTSTESSDTYIPPHYSPLWVYNTKIIVNFQPHWLFIRSKYC